MPTDQGDAQRPEIIIGAGEVTLEDLIAVARAGRRVSLSSDQGWIERIQGGRRWLDQALAEGRRVYGVSTGVGSKSALTIDPTHTEEFAYQIIRQHGCGLGQAFTEAEGRAIVLARLVCLAKGYSAVSLALLEALRDLLNHGVIPVIPSLGSVGASGDLTPLSYLAAVLAGEREAYYGGEAVAAGEALRRAGLSPYRFRPKESLSIMNGTSVMTALGLLTVRRFELALSAAERAAALEAEILFGRSLAFHPTPHRLKGHPGQIASAENIRSAFAAGRLMDRGQEEGRIVQDPYSIRCAPHVIGAARDALAWARQVLERELNSVNDNPIVDYENREAIFAGNFYGGHVALAMDLIKTAAASVADLLDRQFALLLDSRLNFGLSETLVQYQGCGLKGLQITCSALTARAVQRSAPDTVLSRPTEVYNQDKVSMGLNAALNAAEVVTLVQQVLATHSIAVSNAAAQRDEALFSPGGKSLLDRIRAISPVLTEDRRLDREIEGLTRALDQGL
ncbi:MAG: aromatic amino acid ammonia-lyase [Thermodesulfobacteriota bacterium]